MDAMNIEYCEEIALEVHRRSKRRYEAADNDYAKRKSSVDAHSYSLCLVFKVRETLLYLENFTEDKAHDDDETSWHIYRNVYDL